MTRDTDRIAGVPSPRRRRLLATGAVAAAAGLAGCFGTNDDEQAEELTTEPTATTDEGETDAPAPRFPRVEDPPAAVYVPTHFEAARRLDPVRAGPFELVPMVTYPHRFWNVTGREVTEADPPAEGVHLMVTVRDPETGTVLPAETGLELTVGPEGETGSTYAPWPMISQEMGFHLGDNVPLDGDGTYEVEVRVGAVDARLTGAFAGRFDEPGRGRFTFEYDQEFRNEVVEGIRYLDEEFWGERGALLNRMGADGAEGDAASDPPHDRERWREGEGRNRFGTFRRGPAEGELPPASDLPGERQGTPTTGDAVLAATLLPRGSRFVDGGYYLAVSPRTPYNRAMLPMTDLSYALERDGERVGSGSLRATLDPELGYHYAAALESVADGDRVTVTVDAPPQASRHAGYETAFREMPPVEYALTPP